MCVCVCVYVYMCVGGEREREREKKDGGILLTHTLVYLLICVGVRMCRCVFVCERKC